MDQTATDSAAAPATLSPMARAAAVFTRPTRAWDGLRERAQWYWPMLVVVVIAALTSFVLHERAVVPMILDGMEQQVADGQMPAAQLERMEAFFTSPAGMAITVAQQVILLPLMTFIIALLVWFGVGFVLGTDLRYRHALEVASWASLINMPAYLLTTAIAWSRETMRGVHIGFGALLPDVDPPTKLNVALGVFLDGIGPFGLWYLAVGIIGASVLSGAKRNSVAWVIGVLYLVFLALMAALAALSVQ
jgi:hypothetical protein